jgi:hypothetical protein
MLIKSDFTDMYKDHYVPFNINQTDFSNMDKTDSGFDD